MRHIAEGTLRRLEDEPDAVPLAARRHLETCPRCQARRRQIAADAQRAAALLSAGGPAPDAGPAWHRLQQRIAMTAPEPSTQERIVDMIARQRGRLLKPVGGLAAAAALAGALALTPAGAWAGNFLTVFEPTHVQAVSIDPNDLKSLPDLGNYGTIRVPQKAATQRFAQGADAARAAGLPLLTPASLPSGVPATATYEVIPGATGSFTFSAAKAKAAAAAQGKTLPPMPANLDGATLQVTTGNALVEVYADQSRLQAGAAKVESDKSAGAGDSSQELATAAQAAGPMLIVGEMTAPSVSISGNGDVTVKELAQYLLAQPGISPNLRNVITALSNVQPGSAVTALPIPIPINQAASQNVTLRDGTPAVVVGDSTGLIGGIVWEKGKVIYGLAGQLTQQQLVALANGLVS